MTGCLDKSTLNRILNLCETIRIATMGVTTKPHSKKASIDLRIACQSHLDSLFFKVFKTENFFNPNKY